MDRSDILEILRGYGLRPVRGRGQNFLCDPKVVEAMTDAAGVGSEDRVLEIGPGPGILTEELISRGARVLAVELDPALARVVEERVVSDRFEVLRGDALDFSSAELAGRLEAGEGEYKVVANLPYSITSDALRKFITERPRPSSFTVMVQREVADRVVAGPPGMSLLAVVIQIYGQARKVMNVPAGAFFPKPKVNSAVLHVRLYDEMELAGRLGGVEPEKLIGLARECFSERRKQLKNTLARRFPKDVLEQAFESSGISPTQRPERLSIADWVRLTAALIR